MRSKFTEPIKKAFLAQLKQGATYRIACAAVGINEKTFYRWIAKGKEQKRGAYATFVENVMKSNAIGAGSSLQTIQTEARTNWKAAAWLLERRYNYRRDSKICEQITIEESAIENKPASPKDIVWSQLNELQISMKNARSSGSWQAYAALQRAYMSSYREYRELCEATGDYDEFETMSDQQLIDQITEVYIGLPPIVRDQIHENITSINKSVIEFKK